jgi:hypothetical protein
MELSEAFRLENRPRRFPRLVGALAALLLLTSSIVLGLSIKSPFWSMELKAPQYPKGLHLSVFLNRVEGDVEEVDTLNHYIGVGRLELGAAVERALGIPATCALATLLLAGAGAALARRRWATLFALPAVAFPGGFVIDLAYWMHRLSTNLDPHAPIKMKNITFALSGETKVAQFVSRTAFEHGFHLTVAAAAGALVACLLVELAARLDRRGP